MQPEWSPRIGWAELPGHVRAGIEQILGAPVIEATGQQGGFSPGTADRVLTASGQRAFVKAVSPQLNEHSPGIHRKEAAVAAALPAGVPAPALIGTYDDGEWVALVLSDVEGRHPHVPWHAVEVHLVLDALLKISRTPLPPELGRLPTLETELADPFRGWTRIRRSPPEGCDPWVLRNLDTLERLAEQGLRDVAGGSLAHTDVRADNILITAADGAVLVDWPWAAVGAPWVDALTVLVNVRVFDPAFDVGCIVEFPRRVRDSHPGERQRIPFGPGSVLHRCRPATATARAPHSPGFPAAAGRSGHSLAAGQTPAVGTWPVALTGGAVG